MKKVFLGIAYKHCPGFKITDENRAVISDIFDWCVMRSDRLNPNRGLWLWGNIGSGKSTLLPIIKDFCKIVRPPENGVSYSFRISNATDICTAFAEEGYDGIKTYIRSRRQAIDDLGTETLSTGHFGTVENVIQYILQRRYDNRHDSFTHVTTNLSPKLIASAYGERILDRCKEMFNFVELNGSSFRK